MKLFNAPSIGNEHIPPHKLIPKTLITQLRTRSYLHEYDAQGGGKPSPYPIRLGITLRIGYGLGLPLPWASYSCRYDRVLSCVIKVFGINLCGGMCSFPIDGALNSFIDVYALFIPQFLTDARGVDDDVLFCVDVPS